MRWFAWPLALVAIGAQAHDSWCEAEASPHAWRARCAGSGSDGHSHRHRSPGCVAKVGDTLAFHVLRDGEPLAGQVIEVRSALSPLGVWLKTDAEGRARSRLPVPGGGLLRGTDLRVPAADADRWDSRFVTLALQAALSGSQIIQQLRST